MELSKHDISQIVREIWSSVLGLQVEDESSTHDALSGHSMAASVQISGEFELAVMLHLSAGLARQSAALMLAVEPDEASSEEIQDGIGELANMVGGSIKNRLGAGCRLSLPTVAEGVNFTLRLPGTRVLQQYSFVCLGEPLQVTVLERDNLAGG